MYAQTRPTIISKVSKAHSGSSALSPLSYQTSGGQMYFLKWV